MKSVVIVREGQHFLIVISTADEYLTSAFRPKVPTYYPALQASSFYLIVRIRAVLRRRSVDSGQTSSTEMLVFTNLRVDEAAHRVWVQDEELFLTATEFRLLIVLAKRAGRVQTRGALLQDVWDMPPDLNTRTVDTHVLTVRKKLGDNAQQPQFIETLHGVGYQFIAQEG